MQMFAADGLGPLRPRGNVIERRIKFPWNKYETGIRPNLLKRGTFYRRKQVVVLVLRDGKGLPFCPRTHPSTGASTGEDLVNDVERRKDPAGIEIRNVIHKHE